MLTPSALSVAPDVSAALAEPHAANAIQVLADALGHDDGPTRVTAAVALLAVSRGLPVQLVAIDAGGVGVEVAAVAEPHSNGALVRST